MLKMPHNIVAVSLASLALAGVSKAANVVVTPSDMQGWGIATYDYTGLPPDYYSSPSVDPLNAATFVNGPATPPAGTGSLRLTTGVEGSGGVDVYTNAFNGTKLSTVTTLSYSTFVTSNSGGVPQDNEQAPYVQVGLDYDNDAQADEYYFFEPVYQTGGYGTVAGVNMTDVPDQRGADGAAPKIGVWENYDILAGGVWTATGGPPLDTFAHILSEHSDATIQSFDIYAGFGSVGNWDLFDGNIDNVTFGTAGGVTTYDFEVPEPGSIGLLISTGAAMLLRRRR